MSVSPTQVHIDTERSDFPIEEQPQRTQQKLGRTVLFAGALALCVYNREGEVEREPLKTKQARNLKSSTFTRMGALALFQILGCQTKTFEYVVVCSPEMIHTSSNLHHP